MSASMCGQGDSRGSRGRVAVRGLGPAPLIEGGSGEQGEDVDPPEIEVVLEAVLECGREELVRQLMVSRAAPNAPRLFSALASVVSGPRPGTGGVSTRMLRPSAGSRRSSREPIVMRASAAVSSLRTGARCPWQHGELDGGFDVRVPGDVRARQSTLAEAPDLGRPATRRSASATASVARAYRPRHGGTT